MRGATSIHATPAKSKQRSRPQSGPYPFRQSSFHGLLIMEHMVQAFLSIPLILSVQSVVFFPSSSVAVAALLAITVVHYIVLVSS